MDASATNGFVLPEDGWFHIAVPGEWPHKPTGLLQVLDDEALASIVSSFHAHSQQPNWPGVLIDFDHQSLDVDKPSVAAGWIVALEKRPTGIWAQIRWSDLGKKSIEGGRYRFISPVWRSTDCALLGDDRIRPLKLMNCAVTNDPNIKGLFPLSNAAGDIPMRFAPPPLPLAMTIGVRAKADVLLHNAARYSPRGDRGLTEAQLRLLHARRGSGGGARPAATPPRYVRDHAQRVMDLEDQRAAVEVDLPDAPVKTTYEQLDVRQVERDAMKAGKDSTGVLLDVNQAKTINAQRRADLDAVRRGIKNQHKSPEARKRALAKHLEDVEREYAKDMTVYERDVRRQEKAVGELDRKLAEENARWNESDARAEIDEAKKAEAARRQAIRDQIAADKEAARKVREQDKARRDTERAKDEPLRQYNAEKRRRSAYIDAIASGDDDYAVQLYPDADHEKMKEAVRVIQSADPASSDAAKVQRHLDALKKKPIPKRTA